MKHLIVVSHPSESSFTMTLARAYADELQSLNQDFQFRDLYRDRFDPLLTAAELNATNVAPRVANDVSRAQDDIRDADVLAIFYPLWWLSMPAMMKGYIDRVFARGFAYESNSGIVRGLLSAKKCVLVTMSGAPMSVLANSGGWNAVEALQDKHIFRSSGFELLEHIHFDHIQPDLPKPSLDDHLARIRLCARTHFAS
ncbi:NAD(P)H-dependent oxidoreductase [Bradyrhizobium sp. dw_78]|uniref:NAD(P)H-dependent oxidoreductase n=1 Tax=Bradyrhizobium sp. dw_78 TaxID=2719793 RepID=UPI001BD68E84|nr:NAD(P)H-dependent oxidoreductase [Bradyrhizobium sp. dw_78]